MSASFTGFAVEAMVKADGLPVWWTLAVVAIGAAIFADHAYVAGRVWETAEGYAVDHPEWEFGIHRIPVEVV